MISFIYGCFPTAASRSAKQLFSILPSHFYVTEKCPKKSKGITFNEELSKKIIMKVLVKNTHPSSKWWMRRCSPSPRCLEFEAKIIEAQTECLLQTRKGMNKMMPVQLTSKVKELQKAQKILLKNGGLGQVRFFFKRSTSSESIYISQQWDNQKKKNLRSLLLRTWRQWAGAYELQAEAVHKGSSFPAFSFHQ